MQIDDPRLAPSAVRRPVASEIVRRVVEEAARSSRAGSEDIRASEALMLALAPGVLDAVAADDRARARAFAALATTDLDGMRAVPPVARVGLLEIGLALARVRVETAVREGRAGAAVLREMDILADQMRSALVALGGPRDGRERR